MSKPRILHVGKFYPPAEGGMERVVAALCHATRERIDSEVLVFNHGAGLVEEQVDDVPVTRLPTFSLARSTPVAASLPARLRRASADLVVLHEPNPWALLSCAIAPPKAPLAVWFHSEVVRPTLQYMAFYHPLVAAVYSRARRIIVSSPALAGHAAALRPYQDRISVIPFGIDADDWAITDDVAAECAAIRSRAAGRPIVLFVGRMVAYKGVDVLLRALQQADVHAVLAGDGPLRQRWMEMAGELGVAPRVEFPGDVSPFELRALYRAADVFVLPSVTPAEAFGFVQLEAMASGTPVISTRLPSGVPWVNQHEVTGLTVAPGNVAELAAAISRVAGDRALRQRLADGAAARVRDEFGLRLMGQRASDLFERLAARSAIV